MNSAMILGAVVVGIITGLIPCITGFKKGKIGLAIGGFFACVVGGLILGLILAIPLCVLFMYLIQKSPKEQKDQKEPKDDNIYKSE